MKEEFLHNSKLTTFSRINRKKQTDTEKLLWFQLRKGQINGYKFRRQFPVYKYILDFYCAEKKLGIELDGSQHDVNREYDEKRSRVLAARGITVLRFWDNDVLRNIDDVLEEICRVLEKDSK